MKIIERVLEKYYLNCCLPSDSVFVASINKYIGCAAEVKEHKNNSVIIRLFEDDDEILVEFSFKSLSYDMSRYYISKIKAL